ESEKNGIWTLQASIFPENTASIELHLKCGFREVGRRDRIAMLNGVWRDTLLFERRRRDWLFLQGAEQSPRYVNRVLQYAARFRHSKSGADREVKNAVSPQYENRERNGMK